MSERALNGLGGSVVSGLKGLLGRMSEYVICGSCLKLLYCKVLFGVVIKRCRLDMIISISELYPPFAYAMIVMDVSMRRLQRNQDSIASTAFWEYLSNIL